MTQEISNAEDTSFPAETEEKLEFKKTSNKC